MYACTEHCAKYSIYYIVTGLFNANYWYPTHTTTTLDLGVKYSQYPWQNDRKNCATQLWRDNFSAETRIRPFNDIGGNGSYNYGGNE